MHILLIPSWYKTKKEPFLGTFFEEQARAFMKLGHQVGILYPEYTNLKRIFGIKEFTNEYYLDNGLPTFTINVQSRIPRIRKLIFWSFGKAVNKVFKEYVSRHGIPDIIHAHSVFYGGIGAYFISKGHKIPLVITEHLTSFISGDINSKNDRSFSRKIYSIADSALIVSNNFKRDLEKELSLNKEIFQVVHNMVADLFFENFTPRFLLPGEEFVFFTNSFLLPRKNHNLLFESVKLLLNKNYKIKLRIGGDGPLMNDLKISVKKMGLENEVVFLGGLSRKQVMGELVNCHAFLLSSLYETFSLVLGESLACGRPVVTTDSGGPRDFINKSNGIIVSEFSPHKFAEAMEKIILNYNRYNQKTISENCFELFNQTGIAKELEKIYMTVLDKRKIQSHTN